jgi:DNA-binding response OmpR family regulator
MLDQEQFTVRFCTNSNIRPFRLISRMLFWPRGLSWEPSILCPRPSILIVEDDAATRELYQRELGRTYPVLACGDEQVAYSLLQGETISVIVLEITALHDQEWNFVTAARTLPGYGDLPIIVCSTLDERRRGAELGVAAYLVKPVVPKTLLDTVHLVLAEYGDGTMLGNFA